MSGRPSAAPPPDDGSDLARYWRVLVDRRRLVLGTFLAVFVAVAAGTYLQRPVYRATGTVEIRKQAAEVVPVEALFELARIPDQHLETQYAVLRSPALARRVIADVGLAGRAGFEVEAARAPGGGLGEEAMEGLVRAFLDRLSIEPVAESRLVEVSFEAHDPELAARVVNSLFENYLELRKEAAEGAVARLGRQVDSVRAQLAESERRLQEFVRAHELFFLPNGEGESENMLEGRLRRLQEQLTEAEALRYEKEALYELVRAGGHGFLDSEAVQQLGVRVAELEAEYARLRSTFSDNYPKTRQVKRQLDAMRERLESERARIAQEIRNDYRAAVQREAMLRDAFERQKAALDRLASRTAEYRILQRDVESHRQLYSMLQQKRKEAGVSAALAVTEVAVVDRATPPAEPVRPAPGRNLPLGAAVGLMLGIGLAFLREYTDPTIRTVEEVGSMADVPILALIPSVPAPGGARVGGASVRPARRLLPSAGGERAQRGTGSWFRIDRDREHPALSEAFSGLRTSVLFEAGGPLPRSILVTSVQAGEGKTTISVNLAISLARLGRRVLLVDADVRRPSVHRAFGFAAGPGLADVLGSDSDWRDLVRADQIPGLDILPAGRPPESPSELLSSPRMSRLVEEAEASYDAVILDSPALLVQVADARILAPLVDGIVVVARSGVTPRGVLRRILQRTPNVIGVVLNDMDSRHLPEYYRDYSAERTDDEAGPRRRSSLSEPAPWVEAETPGPLE